MSTPTIPGSSPSPSTTEQPQIPFGQPQPPAQKPKKPLLKRVWFWVLVVIAAIVVVNVANGGTDTGTAPDAPAQTQEADDAEGAGDTAGEEVAGIGESVIVDDWSVVVTAVGEPVASIGGEYVGTEAQGVFVPVHIAVTNEGNEAQYFFADSFVLVDDQGREFSYSTDATIYGAADGAVSLLDEINPGNTIEGIIFYDVPADATIVSMTVSGGLFTSPVTIDLR